MLPGGNGVAHELDPCRVYGSGGELVAEGFVREHVGAEIEVEAKNFTDRWLRPGEPVILQVLSAVQGECVYDAVTSSAETGRIGLTDLVLRERVQKRSAARVATEIPVRITQHHVAGRPAPLDEPVDAVVIDVSAHGLRLRTRATFDPGERLVVPFPATREPVELVADVLRAEELRAGHAYGCRIVGASERVTDELFRFVLDEQRRQLAERRGR